MTPEKFWDQTVIGENGCILWAGRINWKGYGYFNSRRPNRTVMAHRFAYQDRVGPIPEGMTLDHLCRRERVMADNVLLVDGFRLFNVRCPMCMRFCKARYAYDGFRDRILEVWSRCKRDGVNTTTLYEVWP